MVICLPMPRQYMRLVTLIMIILAASFLVFYWFFFFIKIAIFVAVHLWVKDDGGGRRGGGGELRTDLVSKICYFEIFRYFVLKLPINQLTYKTNFPKGNHRLYRAAAKCVRQLFILKINKSTTLRTPIADASACNCTNRNRKKEPPSYHKINDFICCKIKI